MELLTEITRRITEFKNLVIGILFFITLVISVDAIYVRAADYSMHQTQQSLRWTTVDIRDLTTERVLVLDSLNRAASEGITADPYLLQRLEEIDDELRFQKEQRIDLRKQLKKIDTE